MPHKEAQGDKSETPGEPVTGASGTVMVTYLLDNKKNLKSLFVVEKQQEKNARRASGKR